MVYPERLTESFNSMTLCLRPVGAQAARRIPSPPSGRSLNEAVETHKRACVQTSQTRAPDQEPDDVRRLPSGRHAAVAGVRADVVDLVADHAVPGSGRD